MVDYSKWSLQRIFNRVANHLLKQNKHSHKHAMMDKYGRRCALGCLIPRKEYPKERPLTYGINLIFGKLYEFPEHGLLLNDLQDVHDMTQNTRKWPELLNNICVKYSLKPTPLLNKRLGRK